MNRPQPLRLLRAGLLVASALVAAPLLAGDGTRPDEAGLEEQFRDPPGSARPRVWWHWMNGNVTKDGIAKDLEWMQRIGIGGLQNFDANLDTPQIVDKRLIYMTPGWKDAFRFAVAEADRRGLEFTIAASPGWSETGGPWVPAKDGMKKLVWSETLVDGGKRFTGTLAAPPAVTGPFQDLGKAPSITELMAGKTEAKEKHRASGAGPVLAFPVDAAADAPLPLVRGPDGSALDAAALFDGNLRSSVTVMPPAASDGAAGQTAAPAVTFEYPRAQTIRSATVHMPGSWMMWIGGLLAPKLQASADGKSWRRVADVELGSVPTTVSFAPVTAKYFRVVLEPRLDGVKNVLNQPAEGIDLAGTPYGDIGAAQSASRPITLAEINLSAQPRVDSWETKAGFTISPDYYALNAGLPDDAGVAAGAIIDLTGKVKPDGTLDWTPPKGRWKVLRFGWSLVGTENHPAPDEATGLEVDKFDGAAVRRYLEHYLSMYDEAVGDVPAGRDGLDGILTDSIEVGASNWTPAMLEQFRRLRGYDPLPWLPVLTGTIIGSRSQSDAFLYDFRRTLADLLASEHYGTVAAVAHENGIKVYGEALENGRPSLGDDMAMRRHADIPMSAMWTHTREEGPRLAHLADIKGASSVAHIYGQNLAAAESLTSSLAYWDHGPAYLKRVIDLAFSLGLNRPVIHTSVHQPVDDKVPGLSLGIFGQYFNRHEAWGQLARPWVDYLSRNALMLQAGRNHADIAYFFGEEAPLTAHYQNKPIPRIAGHAYDFVNADALLDALSVDGNEIVSSGGARYKAIVLGGTSSRMTLPVLRRIAELAEGGATVIGAAPESSPSLKDDAGQFAALRKRLWAGGEVTKVGKGRVIALADAGAGIALSGIASDFRFTGASEGAHIPFVHRKLADGHSYFLVNPQARSETIEARFRVTGKVPELWRAETGTSEPVSYRMEGGETVVPLTLASDESVHVVFRKDTSKQALTIEKPEPRLVATLDQPWQVSFQKDRGAPASVTLPKLLPLDEHGEAGVKHFSGLVTYQTGFRAPAGWRKGQKVWLDLGEAREVAEVLVNGKHAGYAWHAPYRIDISQHLRAGANTLEVRVANLWVNRLIGDAGAETGKVTWTALKSTYRGDAKLRRSGLIGPVSLLAGE